MKKLILILAWAGLLLAQPAIFNPFSGIGTPKELKKVIGSWARYDMIGSPDKNEGGSLKLSLVGQERCDSKGDCFWFEFELKNKNGDRDIVKYLVSDITEAGEKASGNFIMITKHNDEPAQAIQWDFGTPVGKEENVNKDDKASVEPKSKVEAKTEDITVPAGTFKCTHIISYNEKGEVESEAWSAPEVPMTGIVKLIYRDGKEQVTIVLTGYGFEGAKSAITENPKPIKMNELFKNMMQESEKNIEEDEEQENIMQGIQNIFGR